jgi:hypothetical protein
MTAASPAQLQVSIGSGRNAFAIGGVAGDVMRGKHMERSAAVVPWKGCAALARTVVPPERFFLTGIEHTGRTVRGRLAWLGLACCCCRALTLLLVQFREASIR